MDPIELTYDSMDKVPEAFRPLYTEQDGKAVLSGINGLKTQKDVDVVKEALRKERADHEAVRTAFKPWANLKADEVLPKLNRIAELEEAAKGKIDESQIEKIVAGRLTLKTGPLEQALNEKDATVKTLTEQVTQLRTAIADRDRNEQVRSVSTKMKVLPTAVDDVMLAAQVMMTYDETGKLVTKDGLPIPAGLDVEGFMKSMFKLRPHWWPESEGGGSRGGQGGGGLGKNPWSKDNWSLTEQGRILREEGQSTAERYAKAAGSYIGATAPKG